MGCLVSTKRSKLYNELSPGEQKYFFDLTQKKFIPHVDTLYYSIFLENDVSSSKLLENVPENFLEFIDFLKTNKSLFDSDESLKFQKDFWLDAENTILFSKRCYSIYNFCIRKEGYYDIFISDYVPNESTPRILVQLRSIGLWTVGEYDLILESYKVVEKLVSMFNIKIAKCQENRIDFCYHTNSIQKPSAIFSDDILIKNLHTTFKLGSKAFDIAPKRLEITYLSLGKRQSNNIFFRSYNKAREVIEENYKEFFLELWYDEGLINYYDFYVYSFAYKHNCYDYIYKGMLKFYCEFGKNKDIKENFTFILEHEKDFTLDQIKNFALKICPKTTQVINIEFQCMRKFFYSYDKAFEKFNFPIEHECFDYQLLKIFQILDNRKLFLDYLTKNVVSFEKELCSKERKELLKDKRTEELIYLDFWKRLRSVKTFQNFNGELYREYKKDINREIIVSRIKSSLATLSLYDNNWDTDLNDDMSSLISILNDNDFVENSDGTISVVDNDYLRIKENKKKALKSILVEKCNSRPLKV